MSIEDLPAFNASINAVVSLLLIGGLLTAKAGRLGLHKGIMLGATGLSAIFLTSYVIYHLKHGSTPFTATGWPRYLYFTILITHVLLAAVNLPLIVMTLWAAWKENWARHRKLAKWTWPIWFYVAVTGPLVYLMLNVWFPAA